MSNIIALTGKAHAGKSTLGAALAKELEYMTYAFARPIKTTVNMLFGWDQRHAGGELKEVVDPKWGFSPRHAYQTFGTDWGRKLLRDDIWLKYAEQALSKNKGIIITDLRFENEAKWVRDQGGLVVEVRREGTDFGIQSNHASEHGIRIDLLHDYVTGACRDVSELLSNVPRIVQYHNDMRGKQA